MSDSFRLNSVADIVCRCVLSGDDFSGIPDHDAVVGHIKIHICQGSDEHIAADRNVPDDDGIGADPTVVADDGRTFPLSAVLCPDHNAGGEVDVFAELGLGG